MQMKNKFYFIFVMLLLMISVVNVVSAEITTLGTFQVNQCIDLIQLGAGFTSCNITSVVGPDSVKVISNQVVMTKNGNEYNYTYCSPSSLGSYIVNGFCEDGNFTVFAYNFEITPTGGYENNTTLFIIFILVSTGLLILAFIFKNYVFAIISGFSYLLTGVYTMINGLGSITSNNTQMLSIVIIGFGAIVLITSALELARETYGGDFEDDF